MLVNNKFYFISLPRCASTSFMISCIKNKLTINHINSKSDNQLDNILDWEKMSNEALSDTLTHGHESLYDLENKFGNNFPIITIKRNRHERFISLWKHIIDETHRTEDINKQIITGDTFYCKYGFTPINENDKKNYNHNKEILQKLKVDDILFFNSEDLIDNEKLVKMSKVFFEKNGLTDSSIYFKNIFLSILVKPYSLYHHHDSRVIWFELNKLYELEEWVSNILNIDFKLEKINSSQHFECALQLDDYFIEKYNKIYDIYDFKKEHKTLI